jgi:hypothetical protein
MLDFLRATRPDYYRARLRYCEPGTPIERQRTAYDISGEGFVPRHAMMDTLAAVEHIDRVLLAVQKSKSPWLPQRYFDVWIIPYLLGKGVSLDQFKGLTGRSQRLPALEIASVPEAEKRAMRREFLQKMVAGARHWGPIA